MGNLSLGDSFMKLKVRSEGTFFLQLGSFQFRSCSWRGESQVYWGRFSFTSQGNLDGAIPSFSLTWR